jgi:hypothetical protein
MTTILDHEKLTLPYLGGSPANPAASHAVFFFNSSGVPYYRLPDGTEVPLGMSDIKLYDDIATNDSGGYLLDTNTASAQLCKHLEISALLRSGVAATFDTLWMMFNGDGTAANYRNTYLSGDGTSATSANANNQSIGFPNGNTAPSGSHSFIRMFIPNFKSTTIEKEAHIFLSNRLSTVPSVMFLTQFWLKTPIEAITAIRIRPDGYPTDTFTSSSRLTLRGWL